MEDNSTKSLSDYLNILLRRKKTVIIPAILLIIATVITAYVLPATYKSEGVILIESQEIPGDLVRTTITSYASQRIEFIKQKIMTAAKIMEIINKYNLYADIRHKSAESELVNLFRKSLGVKMVEANVTDSNGHRKKATIAFRVSFLDKSPQNAQKITSDLVTEFLNENVKTRTDRAAETTEFIQEEANKFQRKIQLQEKEIADFKDQYSNSLPELMGYNLNMVSSLQESIDSNKNQRMALDDQITTMSLELANIPPYLDTATTQVAGGRVVVNSTVKQLADAELKLSQMLSKYSAQHPDVIRLKRQIKQLKEEVASENANSNDDAINSDKLNSGRVINPIYLQIKSKIDSSEREIVRLNQMQQDLEAKLEDFNARIYKTHQVKRAYDDLSRDYENNLAKYKELRAKQLEAELAQNLESENKGESFTLIEPPRVPDKAEKPNRPKIILMGTVGSFGVGIGLALLIEMFFGGLRGANEIKRVTGITPLVVLPVVKTINDDKKRKSFNKKLFYLFIIILLITIPIFHFFVMNLEVLWYKVMTKVSLL